MFDFFLSTCSDADKNCWITIELQQFSYRFKSLTNTQEKLMEKLRAILFFFVCNTICLLQLVIITCKFNMVIITKHSEFIISFR